jgi:hypothetical protein
MEFVRAESAQSFLNSAQAPDPLSPTQSAIVHYTAELHTTINRHCDSILQLLKLSALIKPLPDLFPHYDKLRGASFPIISGLTTLTPHLSGEEISRQELEILTHQIKEDALELHAASMPPKVPSPYPVITTNCSATGNAPPPQVPHDPILPPGKIKSSLKTGKFHPVFASTPPPRQTESTNADPDNEEDDPGIYSKTINKVGDGTHVITASFIKTNDKIRDHY